MVINIRLEHFLPTIFSVLKQYNLSNPKTGLQIQNIFIFLIIRSVYLYEK